MDYNSFNFDQKVTRVMGAHAVKLGFRWSRELGSKTNPQANGFTYNNLDDLLANRASAFLLAMGNPPHSAWLDQYRWLHPGRLARQPEAGAQRGS